MTKTLSLSPEINWKTELKQTAQKYHRYGAWFAVTFNLLFYATDYFTLPEHRVDFLIFRVAVSFTTLIVLLMQFRIGLKTELLIFIPVLLISIQNAYMWSFMDEGELQKHAFAYIALFIGAGMFVLWQMPYSYVLVGASILANVLFLGINSKLSTADILSNGGLLTAAVMGFSIFLIQTRYNLTVKEIKARLKLKESNEALNEQKEIVESKNRSILASINYAEKIQKAILPSDAEFTKYLKEHFVLYIPRDIVSGDFYWIAHEQNKTTIVAADCTGHGVPGAFMSMIGNSLLNKLVVNIASMKPSDILFNLRKEVIASISQGDANSKVQDGMDMALCIIDHENNKIEFSGAYNPLYIYRGGEIITINADKMPIGRHIKNDDKPFTTLEVQIEPNDTFYIFSDGYFDQFGGPEDKKMGSKAFRDKLASMGHLPLIQQQEELLKHFNDWKNEGSQMDDVLLIGFRV